MSSVSKQVQHSIQPLLRDAAEQRLQRLAAFSFSSRDREKFVQHLVALLPIAGRHISDEAWTNFLQQAKDSNIDPRLIVVLQQSVAGDNAAPGKDPDTVWVPTSDVLLGVIGGPKLAAMICAAGMKEMMRVDRLGVVNNARPTQLSLRPAWKQLAYIFDIFYPATQVDLLLQVKPRESDGANIGLAFDELLDMHLAGLVESGTFSCMNQWLWREPSKRSAYFDILSNAYTMAGSPDQPTYFQEICRSAMPSFGLGLANWRHNCQGSRNFIFRSLAYEIRTNGTGNLKTFSYAIRRTLKNDVLTHEELEDFTKKLNLRMDKGMPLGHAVSMWIDENTKESTCLIS